MFVSAWPAPALNVHSRLPTIVRLGAGACDHSGFGLAREPNRASRHSQIAGHEQLGPQSAGWPMADGCVGGWIALAALLVHW